MKLSRPQTAGRASRKVARPLAQMPRRQPGNASATAGQAWVQVAAGRARSVGTPSGTVQSRPC